MVQILFSPKKSTNVSHDKLKDISTMLVLFACRLLFTTS